MENLYLLELENEEKMENISMYNLSNMDLYDEE